MNLALVNGLTLNSTLTIASSVSFTNLNAVGTQTIDGTGTVVFGGTGFDNIQPSAGVVTIGPNITIQTGSGGGTLGSAALGTTNRGTISSQTAGAGIVLAGAFHQSRVYPGDQRRVTAFERAEQYRLDPRQRYVDDFHGQLEQRRNDHGH